MNDDVSVPKMLAGLAGRIGRARADIFDHDRLLDLVLSSPRVGERHYRDVLQKEFNISNELAATLKNYQQRFQEVTDEQASPIVPGPET